MPSGSVLMLQFNIAIGIILTVIFTERNDDSRTIRSHTNRLQRMINSLCANFIVSRCFVSISVRLYRIHCVWQRIKWKFNRNLCSHNRILVSLCNDFACDCLLRTVLPLRCSIAHCKIEPVKMFIICKYLFIKTQRAITNSSFASVQNVNNSYSRSDTNLSHLHYYKWHKHSNDSFIGFICVSVCLFSLDSVVFRCWWLVVAPERMRQKLSTNCHFQESFTMNSAKRKCIWQTNVLKCAGPNGIKPDSIDALKFINWMRQMWR